MSRHYLSSVFFFSPHISHSSAPVGFANFAVLATAQCTPTFINHLFSSYLNTKNTSMFSHFFPLPAPPSSSPDLLCHDCLDHRHFQHRCIEQTRITLSFREHRLPCWSEVVVAGGAHQTILADEVIMIMCGPNRLVVSPLLFLRQTVCSSVTEEPIPRILAGHWIISLL
jgi:hypothetical protein